MRVSAVNRGRIERAAVALAVLLSACRGEHGASRSPACDTAGIVSSRTFARADLSEVAVEIVQTGCANCGESKRPGASEGSPCAAASVCAETCCECPRSSPTAYFRARVCDSGRCAESTRVCESARSAISPDVCPVPQSSPRNSSTAMP